jgi:branched-chain amino acid transport system permease protein
MLTQTIVNGLAAGGVYSLLSCGFNIIFSVTRIFHMAFGAVILSAGYSFYLLLRAGIGFPLASLLSVLCGILIGLFVEGAIYRPLREKRSSQATLLISSLGFLLFVQAAFSLFVGTEIKSVWASVLPTQRIGGVTFTLVHVVIFGLVAICYPLLFLFMTRTKYGYYIRAVEQDPALATAFGISSESCYVVVTIVGSLIAGVAVIPLSFDIGMIPSMGFNLVILASVAVIVGGVGNITGAALGGFLLGLVENFASLPFNVQWRQTIVYLLLFVVLALRPEGLFGKEKIRRA